MKHLFLTCTIFLILVCILPVRSQTKKENVTNSKPKLVVGIVIDQMRNDYIYRYWNRYGNGGFKRLVREGYYFKNAHYNYIPTYTGPGHSSIYTGATPRSHGIIANDWFVKKTGMTVYCTQDTSVRSVGSANKNGRMSPKNQLSTTIGDELKMNSNQNAKVFAVALKDRSSILPAGHAANGAFWFDDLTGNFITSTWYMKELPQWLKNFNDRKLVRSYLEKGWSTLYAINTYSNSISDDNRYEAAPGKEKPVFPYEYNTYLEKKSFEIIKATPYGNSITKDLALACLKNEELGKDGQTDMLCISFSSTDYVGHSFGPRAIEVEDVYLRLDKDLEELLNTLDKEVGKNKYTVFLTADHGAADVPNHLTDNKIPAGYIKEKTLVKEVKDFFKTFYGDTNLFSHLSNEQVFLNEEKCIDLKLNKNDVEENLCRFLIRMPGVSEAYSSAVLKNGSFSSGDYRTLLQNGYNHKLSGNVAFIYEPAWMDQLMVQGIITIHMCLLFFLVRG
jgi:predicted AlkP superfamily pyrophosphatase or phosphodiesterase